MRLLVYGFKPYLQHPSNITEKIVAALPSREPVVKRVFDVVFDASMFLEALSASRADVVLGLGQHPRARKVRIERRAVNRRAGPGEPPRPIDPQGPESLAVNWRIDRWSNATLAYDAGAYVCNFSMYCFLRECRARDIPYAFLHIPARLDLEEAVESVAALIDDAVDEKGV